MKMENTYKPECRTTPFDGKKAVIIGDHPHADAVAICQRAEYTNIGWGMVFKRTDDDTEFFVFNKKNAKWL
jgi:hypothetical protein